jgi:hypothetical protein
VPALVKNFLNNQDELNARLRDKYHADLFGPAIGCSEKKNSSLDIQSLCAPVMNLFC